MSLFDLELPKLKLKKVKKLTPKGRQVLIIPMEVEQIQQTGGGLYVVAQENDPSDLSQTQYPIRVGRILAVGDSVEGYNEGDVVYYHKYAGQDGDTLQSTFLQMDSDNIWGFADVDYYEADPNAEE